VVACTVPRWGAVVARTNWRGGSIRLAEAWVNRGVYTVRRSARHLKIRDIR
jgi:hypothetical protein